MKQWFAFITTVFYLFITSDVRAQLAFDHLKVENGLSQNSVLAITKDRFGFMWFGTRNGLNRFDGHRFKTYLYSGPDDENRLLSNYITTLSLDSDQKLLIGTSKGLNVYSESSDSFEKIHYQPLEESTILSRQVSCLLADNQKRLWIGTKDGLYIIDHQGKATRKSLPFIPRQDKGKNEESINALYQDRYGLIWIGTTRGLFEISLKTGQIRHFTSEPDKPGTLNDHSVTAFCEDNLGRLWIGTFRGGLNLFNRPASTFINFSNKSTGGLISNTIRSILPDHQNNIWVATIEGLSIFNTKTFNAVNYRHESQHKTSLSNNSLYALFRDKNNSFWIGTYYGGINVYNPQNIAFKVYQHSAYYSSISDDVISCFQEDSKGNLWIGTEGGGLNYLDKRTGRFTQFKHHPNGNSSPVPSNQIKDIFLDRDKNIWIGTHGGGLAYFDEKLNKFTTSDALPNASESFKPEVSFIFEDSRRRFWVATNDGLKLFSRIGKQLTPTQNTYFPNPKFNARHIIETREGRVLFSNYDVLYEIKRDALAASAFSLADLQVGAINCIFEDSKKKLWLGTDKGVINWPSKKVLNKEQGLSDNHVVGIVEDQHGYLWVSTNNGMSRLDPASDVFRNYTTHDGLPGNEFTANAFYKNSSGEIYMGGLNGFFSFTPSNSEVHSKPYPMFFTELKVMDILWEKVKNSTSPFFLIKEIHLPYHRNDLTLNFALLNFMKPYKNRYAYLLEGYHKEWIFTDESSVVFSRLPPGTFTLKVKGADNNGIWSAPAVLSIRIHPPFWKTWWAYILYFLIIASATILVSRFLFLKALVVRENQLHNFKLSFFTNISHEIRTHLLLIGGPIENLLLESPKKNKNLVMLKKNFDNLLILVNELMDFRKAESGFMNLSVEKQDLISMIREILALFRLTMETKKIRVRLTSSSEPVFLTYDREQIKKVFYNLLSNACKFTPERGQISISITEKAEKVIIDISNTGKRISPQHIPNLFNNYYQVEDLTHQNTGYGIGLALSKNITELHHGSIEVNGLKSGDQTDHRTTFRITLLKGDEHFSAEQKQKKNLLLNKREDLIEPRIYSFETNKTDSRSGAIKEKPYTILLVEDNKEVSELITEMLEHDYRVLTSQNGKAGLETALETIPDLIISDVMMPEMTGFEMCKALRADARTRHIPVIMLTAKTYYEDHISGLEAGADIYLSKPFSMKVLELQVRNLLESRVGLIRKFLDEFNSLISNQLKPERIIPESPIDQLFLIKIVEILEKYMDDHGFTVAKLAREIGMSQPVLYKKLKAITGMTVNDFVKSVKMKHAAKMLRESTLTIYEVASLVGYEDTKHFSREFKKTYGVSPSKF